MCSGAPSIVLPKSADGALERGEKRQTGNQLVEGREA